MALIVQLIDIKGEVVASYQVKGELVQVEDGELYDRGAPSGGCLSTRDYSSIGQPEGRRCHILDKRFDHLVIVQSDTPVVSAITPDTKIHPTNPEIIVGRRVVLKTRKLPEIAGMSGLFASAVQNFLPDGRVVVACIDGDDVYDPAQFYADPNGGGLEVRPREAASDPEPTHKDEELSPSIAHFLADQSSPIRIVCAAGQSTVPILVGELSHKQFLARDTWLAAPNGIRPLAWDEIRVLAGTCYEHLEPGDRVVQRSPHGGQILAVVVGPHPLSPQIVVVEVGSVVDTSSGDLVSPPGCRAFAAWSRLAALKVAGPPTKA